MVQAARDVACTQHRGTLTQPTLLARQAFLNASTAARLSPRQQFFILELPEKGTLTPARMIAKARHGTGETLRVEISSMNLSRRKVIVASVGLGSVAAFSAALGIRNMFAGGTPELLTRTTKALGTEVSISIAHADPALAEAAIDAAFKELDQVEAVLSIYRPDSQVSRLNETGRIDNPHPFLREVLAASLQLSQRTLGAFDVTIQPLWQTYLDAYRQERLPVVRELDEARAKIGWRKVEVAEDHIHLALQGMAVTFNGIAQGFALDRIRSVLKNQGIQHALIDVGELGALGRKSADEPWQSGVQHPRQADAFVAVVPLDDRCLATSGDYATTFTRNREHHHILDARTGRSPLELASASILAPTGMLADGLSTASFILGAEQGRKLVNQYENVDALFITKDGRQFATPGFPALEES